MSVSKTTCTSFSHLCDWALDVAPPSHGLVLVAASPARSACSIWPSSVSEPPARSHAFDSETVLISSSPPPTPDAQISAGSNRVPIEPSEPAARLNVSVWSSPEPSDERPSILCLTRWRSSMNRDMRIAVILQVDVSVEMGK